MLNIASLKVFATCRISPWVQVYTSSVVEVFGEGRVVFWTGRSGACLFRCENIGQWQAFPERLGHGVQEVDGFSAVELAGFDTLCGMQVCSAPLRVSLPKEFFRLMTSGRL